MMSVQIRLTKFVLLELCFHIIVSYRSWGKFVLRYFLLLLYQMIYLVQAGFLKDVPVIYMASTFPVESSKVSESC
jgi:hypothetical protein